MMLVVDVIGDDVNPDVPERKIIPHRYLIVFKIEDIESLFVQEDSKNIDKDTYIDTQRLYITSKDGKLLACHMVRPIKREYSCYDVLEAIIECLKTETLVQVAENCKVYLIDED